MSRWTVRIRKAQRFTKSEENYSNKSVANVATVSVSQSSLNRSNPLTDVDVYALAEHPIEWCLVTCNVPSRFQKSTRKVQRTHRHTSPFKAHTHLTKRGTSWRATGIMECSCGISYWHKAYGLEPKCLMPSWSFSQLSRSTTGALLLSERSNLKSVCMFTVVSYSATNPMVPSDEHFGPIYLNTVLQNAMLRSCSSRQYILQRGPLFASHAQLSKASFCRFLTSCSPLCSNQDWYKSQGVVQRITRKLKEVPSNEPFSIRQCEK